MSLSGLSLIMYTVLIGFFASGLIFLWYFCSTCPANLNVVDVGFPHVHDYRSAWPFVTAVQIRECFTEPTVSKRVVFFGVVYYY